MTRDILKNKKNALRIRVACLVMVSVILGGCVAKEKLEGYLSDSIGRLSGSKEYHVSVNGSDRNKGSASSPFKTISAAADVAQPGDTITVHEGIYRERINPPRGGLSDDMRIVYQAAEGQNVQIKGSEIVVGWKKIQDGVWKVTVPNTFFGNYNPYKDCLAGDWFDGKGRIHHTGEVYLNGRSLFEKATLDEVLAPKPFEDAIDKEASTYTWYCESNNETTTIWANFHDANPNRERVEINVRESCFYPDQPGRNYITVRNFRMAQAATQWAAPTAEQIGLIGTHWSKGWIIENNVISDSKCVGITLGKDRNTGHNVATKDKSKGGHVHYNEVIFRALKTGWSKENIGSHIVRNNTIYNCEAAGICGSLGAVFSQITGNHIYNIQRKLQYIGFETAGIKIHAPIDMLIKNNRIHDTDRGIWLDWMAQGTRVTANLCYNNFLMDLFMEVCHGPYVVDNNIFLSRDTLWNWSHSTCFTHNLCLGKFTRVVVKDRSTPYHVPHSTEVAGLSAFLGGDDRYYNNIMAGEEGIGIYKGSKYRNWAGGNVYFKGLKAYEGDINSVEQPNFDPKVELVEESGSGYLHITLPPVLAGSKTQFIATQMLGESILAHQTFTNYDATPLRIDTDYFGNKRDEQNPTPGPFENIKEGRMILKLW